MYSSFRVIEGQLYARDDATGDLSPVVLLPCRGADFRVRLGSIEVALERGIWHSDCPCSEWCSHVWCACELRRLVEVLRVQAFRADSMDPAALTVPVVLSEAEADVAQGEDACE